MFVAKWREYKVSQPSQPTAKLKNDKLSQACEFDLECCSEPSCDTRIQVQRHEKSSQTHKSLKEKWGKEGKVNLASNETIFQQASIHIHVIILKSCAGEKQSLFKMILLLSTNYFKINLVNA